MIDVFDIDVYYDPSSESWIVIDGNMTLEELRAIMADCEQRAADNDWLG